MLISGGGWGAHKSKWPLGSPAACVSEIGPLHICVCFVRINVRYVAAVLDAHLGPMHHGLKPQPRKGGRACGAHAHLAPTLPQGGGPPAPKNPRMIRGLEDRLLRKGSSTPRGVARPQLVQIWLPTSPRKLSFLGNTSASLHLLTCSHRCVSYPCTH